ncbi:GABA-gated chloride channel receptor [Aphelenchoides besseyi]|nr:GABA-gated chloride channel receptor [Aphelenchoides besseyi]
MIRVFPGYVYLCFQQIVVLVALPVNPLLKESTYRSDNEIDYAKAETETEIPIYDLKLEHNVSRILDGLIASHDRRIRPNYGGLPTEVNVTAHVITISAISEVTMDFVVDLYLRQFWKDTRLAFDNFGNDETTSLTVGIDMVRSIWVPDTFFPNEKKSYFHETTSHNSFLRIDNKGNVIRSIRLTVTANCPMNLHTFPLDLQVCALEIESYGYSTADIIYHWHGPNAVIIDPGVHLAHFTIGGHSHIERTISLSTGNYSRLTTFFTFKRNIGFYLIQIYLPSSLIVVISWVSFWLNREATQARVTIGVTTLLSQTTILTSTNASLPKVSYIKSLDIFLGMSFFLVFASLIEYAAIGYLMKRQRYAATAKNSSQMVYYYEYEDPHPQVRLNSVRSDKRMSIRRSNTGSRNGIEQAMPLLNVSPTTSAGQPSGRLSVAGPLPMLADGNRCCRIRPSQVDLVSRIAFPLLFVTFNFFYWSVYLNAS